jgi:hypothetical protein
MKILIHLSFMLIVSSQVFAQQPAATDSGVGIGNPAPLYRLDIRTALDNDGLRLMGSGNNTRLVLGNTAAGKLYSIVAAGPSGVLGNGNFVITDMSHADSARLLINGNTGYVAIGGGTTNPAEMLTVNGMVQAAGLRLTQNAGVNRILASDASGAATWQPATALSIATGSGTLNYIAKWTPNDSSLGNSQLVDDGTYVGVGTAAPQYKLDVNTTVNNDGIRVSGSSTGNTVLLLRNTNTANEYSLQVGGSTSVYGNGNFAVVNKAKPDTAALVINGTTGNVSIGGLNNPSEKLAVQGNVSASGIRLSAGSPGVNRILVSDVNGYGSWQPASSANLVSGNGTINYIPKWTPNGTAVSNSQLVDDGTNVGVGNTAPLRKLDINSNSAYTGVNITSPQIPSLNLTSTNTGSTGREVIRFGEPAATPGSSTVNAQIGYYRSLESINAGNLVLSADNTGTRPDISISKINNGNVGIGVINASQKLEVNGIIRSAGLLIPSGAAAGKVLTSDAAGNATWQAPATIGGASVIYSNWAASPYDVRDTIVDLTCYKVRHIDAPSLTTAALSTAIVMVYFRTSSGTIGPFHLPYMTDAGGATSQLTCIYSTQKIFLARHTFRSCRYSISVPESYPGEPVMINLPGSLQYRYVIISGTQAGGRLTATGPNEHYAGGLNEIPDLGGTVQAMPGKVYSTVKD